jgi:hypothetical protein
MIKEPPDFFEKSEGSDFVNWIQYQISAKNLPFEQRIPQ